jgi:hypothetical protein
MSVRGTAARCDGAKWGVLAVRWSFVLGSLLGAVACAAGGVDKSSASCRVGSDCPSGACSSDGTCVSVPTVNDAQSASDVAPVSDGGATDAHPTTHADAGAADSTGTCTGNGDFVIDATELPLGPGLRGTFRVASNTAVDTAGKAQADGSRIWDYSGAMTGDTDALVETMAPTGQWWASAFGAASYAVQLSSSSNLLGVFKIDASALSLLGVVSPTSGVMQTQLTYSPAAPFVKLPLHLGDSWNVTSNISGQATGVPSTYTEAYEVKVDAKGKMITPYGSFSVLRVSTVLTRTLGFTPTITRSYGFIAECFGTVASVTSNPDETATEFTTAAEVRRLAP